MKLAEISLPFEIPDRLHNHFREYVAEYGRDAAESSQIHAHRLWAIVDDAGTTVGFVWFQKNEGKFPGLYQSIAVFNEHRGRGHARFARIESEKAIRNEGFTEFFVQVNNLRPATGLRTRQSLLKNGFVLVERPYRIRSELPDDQYAMTVAAPLRFRKQLS